MRIEIEGWVMEVDVSYTLRYSDIELSDNCQCPYCRNYYACMDLHYPELRDFLSGFGVQLHAPEEMTPYELGEKILYSPQFSVAGEIVQFGAAPIAVGDLSVIPTQDALAQERMESAAFSLCVDGILLPWVLDEPGKEMKSRKKLKNRLFTQSYKSNLGS